MWIMHKKNSRMALHFTNLIISQKDTNSKLSGSQVLKLFLLRQHCITCVLNLYAIHMHKHKYTNNGVLVVGYF